MPVNPAVRSAVSPEGAAAPGPAKKSEPNAATDPAFAALLAMLVGAPVPGTVPSPAAPTPERSEGEGVVEAAPVPTPAAPAEALETLLQAQRVVVVPSAQPSAEVPEVPEVPDGTWVIEPVPEPAQAPQLHQAQQALAQAAPPPQTPPPVLEPIPAAEPTLDPAPDPAPGAVAPDPAPGAAASDAAPDAAPVVQAPAPPPSEARATVSDDQPEEHTQPHTDPTPRTEPAPIAFPEPRQVTFAPPTAPRAEATPPARLPTPVDPDRLMSALAQSLSQADDGSYSVTVRLHPEHLGEVKLSLQLSGREVQTVMEVGSAAARQALESRSDQLRQGLDQAGLTLSGFQVSTGQQQRSPGDRPQFDWDESGRTRLTRPIATTTATAQRSIPTPAPSRRGGLDTLA